MSDQPIQCIKFQHIFKTIISSRNNLRHTTVLLKGKLPYRSNMATRKIYWTFVVLRSVSIDPPNFQKNTLNLIWQALQSKTRHTFRYIHA